MLGDNEILVTRNENSTKTILIKENKVAYSLAAVTSIKISISNEAQNGLLVTSRECEITDSAAGEITFETKAADFTTISFDPDVGAKEISPKFFLAQLEIIYTDETDPELLEFWIRLKCDIPVT